MTPAHDLVNEEVSLTAIEWHPTRRGHKAWRGWAKVDGMDAKIMIYPEDERFLTDVLQLPPLPRQGRISVYQQVVLRHEQRNGLRIEGAWVAGEYRTIADYRAQLHAGNVTTNDALPYGPLRVADLTKEQRVAAVLADRLEPHDLLNSAMNKLTKLEQAREGVNVLDGRPDPARVMGRVKRIS